MNHRQSAPSFPAALLGAVVMALLLSPLRASAQAEPTAAWAHVLRSSVECEDPSDCPQSVGVLLSTNAESVWRSCGVTLVAPDVVLTAAHCLFPEMQHQGASCAGARVLLPAAGSVPEEHVDCLEVLQVSDITLPESNVGQEDVAVLRLTRAVDRRTARLSSSGLEDGEMATIYRPRPTPGDSLELSWTIRPLKCAVVHNSVMLPRADGPLRTVQALGACEARPGDSGSGVRDSRGRVAAVVEGVHYAPGDVEAGTPTFRDGFLTLVDPELHDLVEVQEVRTMTTVSNLACTSIPTVRFERNPYAAQTCAAYGLLYATHSAQHDDRRRRMRDFFVQVATARHALVEEAQTYLAGLPDGIEWLVNVHSDRGKLHVDVSAGCRRSATGLPRSVHVPTLEVRAAVLTDSRAQVVTERGERRVSLRGVRRCRT